MQNNDLRSEWAFYGGKLDTIGHLYLRGAKLPARNPDTLFFLLYTCRLLTDKKMSISGVDFIRKNLEYSRERWYEILNWEEQRVFTLPCRTIPYRGYARSCISSSILFKDKPVFRSGRMGFGFFSNGKHFIFCAGGSVFGLIETIYQIHSKEPKDGAENLRRRVNAEQGKVLDELFTACAYVRRLELGRELNRGNCNTVAYAIYRAVTNDTYPPMTEAEIESMRPAMERIQRELADKAAAAEATGEAAWEITEEAVDEGGAASSNEMTEDLPAGAAE